MYTKVRLFLLLALVSVFSAHVALAQSDCPAGTRPATTADAVVQNGTIKAGTCYNPNEVGIGQNTETAKVFLNSVPKKCVGACAAPPDKAHIEKLNDTFATCAANFIKAYNQTYGVIYISSAYRDGPSGENARAGGAPNSNHTKGLAIDMSPANGDFQTMWKFASQNPQFGVCFPYLGSDRPHMTLAGSGTGESNKCAAQGVTKQCSGAPIFNAAAVTAAGPATPYDEGGAVYGNTGTAPAVSPYSSPYPQSFPGAPAPTYAQTPVATTPFTSPLTTTNTPVPPMCTPQFSCSNNVMYYQTTSCTTQVYQTCTKGCDGNSCANIATTVGTSTLVKDPETKASSTTEELLNAFANPVTFSSSAVATGTSLAVILNGGTSNDVIAIANGAAPTTISSGTITSIQPLSSQQTFTSPDLVNSGAGTYTSPSTSGVQKILSDLKAALVWAIGYLKSLSSSK